ncbi:jg18650 [Pararge aegeria aegeria]|uniref:Jg18650 protein n=1 Tax=Pararge aegeria aegeria TaxID=348720 RepID=A0A8S4RA86_9NEOP|nr:jg18650 [Pararge aegeria aegeria]
MEEEEDRSFVGSYKFHGFVQHVSSGSLRLSTSLGVNQRCAYQCGAAIPAIWAHNVHPFSELCAQIASRQLRYLSYVGNSGSSTDLLIYD